MSKTAVGNKNAVSQVERQFAGKVNFIKLDWSSAKGKEAATAFTIEKAPASIVIDLQGNVVAKIQGPVSAAAMKYMLTTVTSKSGR